MICTLKIKIFTVFCQNNFSLLQVQMEQHSLVEQLLLDDQQLQQQSSPPQPHFLQQTMMTNSCTAANELLANLFGLSATTATADSCHNTGAISAATNTSPTTTASTLYSMLFHPQQSTSPKTPTATMDLGLRS
jgi:hypothetical protein